MIRPQSTRKAQMKTILMLIAGLMLAGCGSMENHPQNHGFHPTSSRALSGPAEKSDQMQTTRKLYETRQRREKRAVDLIADALPFGQLWFSRQLHTIK